MVKIMDYEISKKEQGVAEGRLDEFAPGDDEEKTLLFYARTWYNGDLSTQQQVEKILDRMGWSIGEIEDGEGGCFVVRAGDEHGRSYIPFSIEDLTGGQLDEIKKGQKDSNGYTRCWPGKHAEGTKKGKNGGQVRDCRPNESVDEAANAAQQAAIAINMKKQHKKPKNIAEGAPISTTPNSIEPGGAVDNFKQQMANNTELAYKKGMAEGYDEDDECNYCHGTGEGQFDGQTCSHCHGTGVNPPEYDDDDFESDRDYYESFDPKNESILTSLFR
jgi:hypothetical protein